MKGGHAKVGPIPATAATRRKTGRQVRERHRVKGRAGEAVRIEDVAPPPYLTEREIELWNYYGAELAREGRLTAKARDTLAKYCTLLELWRQLREEMAKDEYRHVMLSVTVDGAGNQHVNAKANPILIQVQKLAQLARGYEADLILCPAVAVRMPSGEADDRAPEDDEFGLGTGPIGVVRKK